MNNFRMGLPPISITNKWIAISVGALFILNAVIELTLKVSLSSLLALSGSWVLGGGVHSLFTYAFVATGLMEVIFNALLFWMIGSELERRWGEKSYRKFLFVVILFSAILYLLISALFYSTPLWGAPLFGSSALASSMILIYGLIYPEQTFSFMLVIPIQAKYFTWILIAIELYTGIFTPYASGSIGALSSMLVAFLYFKWINREPRRAKRSNSHLKVVHDSDKVGPKYYQ